MPIPSKKVGEKQSQYMIRCVPELMKYHDKQQAIAICYRTFQGKMMNLETYNDYPARVSNIAKKLLRWKDKYGDEVKGITKVGWVLVKQLASKEKISRQTIEGMAKFKKNEKYSEVRKKFEDTAWKDEDFVAWLGWGGASGINWAIKKLKQIDKK